MCVLYIMQYYIPSDQLCKSQINSYDINNL